MMDLKKVKLTETQKIQAEDILRNWAGLNKRIAAMSLAGVRNLLAFELATRCRLTIVQRLTARYGVLEQRENEREVAGYLAKKLSAHRPVR